MRAATATGPECAQLLLSAKGVIDSFSASRQDAC
jgi:hypothetical protein